MRFCNKADHPRQGRILAEKWNALAAFAFFPLMGWLPSVTAPGQEFPRSIWIAEHSFLQERPVAQCYRWMGKLEMNRWKSGKAALLKLPKGDVRGGSTRRSSFCWTHPWGSILALYPQEIYGKYLMRIDLVDDAVVYDRSLGKYYARSKLKPEQTRGLDTDVLYHLIQGSVTEGTSPEGFYFQELVLRDPSAIRGWTFSDPDLKRFAEEEYHRLQSDQLSASEFHFFVNQCGPWRENPQSYPSPGMWKRARKRCINYKELAAKRREFLERFWEKEPERYYENEAARKPPALLPRRPTSKFVL
jgi:hypothetical protein